MTINVLLCEGEEKSPDIRLLRTIFLGINNLTVEAAGGKGGFEHWLKVCKPDGEYFQHYLVYFAGKDFRKAIDKNFAQFGLNRIRNSFEANILNGLENAADPAQPVWTWLPEWLALRNGVESYPDD